MRKTAIVTSLMFLSSMVFGIPVSRVNNSEINSFILQEGVYINLLKSSDSGYRKYYKIPCVPVTKTVSIAKGTTQVIKVTPTSNIHRLTFNTYCTIRVYNNGKVIYKDIFPIGSIDNPANHVHNNIRLKEYLELHSNDDTNDWATVKLVKFGYLKAIEINYHYSIEDAELDGEVVYIANIKGVRPVFAYTYHKDLDWETTHYIPCAGTSESYAKFNRNSNIFYLVNKNISYSGHCSGYLSINNELIPFKITRDAILPLDLKKLKDYYGFRYFDGHKLRTIN